MIASTYKESKLGIDALRFSLTGNTIQSDFYWIPVFTPSILPLARNNPLNPLLFPSDFDSYSLNNPESQDDFDRPELKIYNSEFAARISMYFSRLDLSFYGFYGWDDLPFIEYSINSSGDAIDVKGSYKRMAMLGADAAIPAGDFVFRLESAVFPQRYMQSTLEYQSEKHTQLLGLAGFDWTPYGGWTITAQYIADYAFGSVSKLEREVYLHQVSLTLEKAFFNDNLNLSFLGFLDLKDFSSMTELSAEYSLSDAIKLALIADFYNKGIDGKDGIYGIYKDLSSATIRCKISF